MADALREMSKEGLLAMLASMRLVRTFEERAAMMYGLRKIGGFCHLYTGQEAVAIGAVSVLDLAKDYVLTAYRDHGHALALGMPPREVMAELFGKVSGCSRGKGGSMHLFDPGRRMLGGNGIVGAQIPVATGVALAQAYRKDGGATLCFFGDGAFHQGALHESLNLAKVWSLPIVYVVENNQWGMGTNWKKVSSEEDFAATASAYGMRGASCDGMDVLAVRGAVAEALALARRGEPSLVEARTYRYRGHSMSDPQKYRSKDDVEEYRRRDPLAGLEARLLEAGLATEADLAAIAAAAEAAVDDAVAFAESSAQPSAGELYADVYAAIPPRPAALS
jgi:pyruvate dehydrogenase E1 component alpha subunit